VVLAAKKHATRGDDAIDGRSAGGAADATTWNGDVYSGIMIDSQLGQKLWIYDLPPSHCCGATGRTNQVFTLNEWSSCDID